MNSIPVVYVNNFKGSDDAAMIRAAIQHAIETQAEFVIFEPRRYMLQSAITFDTAGFEHDAGSSAHDSKVCHIVIQGSQKLTLLGAVDEQGDPATVFVGINDLQIHGYLPAILWCEDNERLALKNIAFSREPFYASAGVVIAKSDSHIVVDVFEGNPCYDGMGCYCMNRFNPETGALTGESVTYGSGAGVLWKRIAPNQLSLTNAEVAAKVALGEYVSWHQGAQTDFQTYFARCNHLNLSNIRTYNSNGFCMLTEACKHITAERVIFKPDGNRLFTAPRDAWKIFKCNGDLNIDQLIIEGVRMDGQNMHSNWLIVKEVLSDDEALFFCHHTFAKLEIGSVIELNHEEDIYRLTIADWHHEGKGDRGNYYRIRLNEKLPVITQNGMLGSAACWEPDRYICKNSEFTNIAGAGHLVRYDHVVILNCTYKNTMNPGILLGAELPVHAEGGHATDILIKDCEFDNCGFFPRYEAAGCIGVKSAGFSGKFNTNIVILNNTMKNSEIGVHAIDAHNVFMIGNTFEGISVPLLRDEEVNGTIYEHLNQFS
ncbi:right-handed parallel beta-helix repeat-containing protein [Paenibacillus qinlingensis]|uniref:Right handed beta helix domain-containing protein n=1 Tax=Paenibacillus qinlingensis TaxID=1837343 RepID=A0ABU1P317_9BACL|nr:right-handed parallel beta-helix repeat-containing protein [Paenibacillus qinlingensis]MDR6553939.1 hypothetical protein [Paenibacillus qinlingensis]